MASQKHLELYNIIVWRLLLAKKSITLALWSITSLKERKGKLLFSVKPKKKSKELDIQGQFLFKLKCFTEISSNNREKKFLENSKVVKLNVWLPLMLLLEG